VELGVKQRRGLVVAFSSQYKLAGATAPPSMVEDLTLRRNRKGGASVELSETHVNSGKDSLWVFQMARGLCAKRTPRACARRVSLGVGRIAVSGWFQPVTIHFFSFSFSTRIREFIKNSRKMVKI
jgi:hypothetical protein